MKLELAYQPDLVKGEVSGSITGVGIQASPTSYSVAVLVEPSSGESIGMDLNPTEGTIPVAFAIPFALDTIDPAKSYVVTAEIVDGTTTWENTTGVPVITQGNAISDIQVVVTPVVPAPSPTPVPAAPAESGGDATPALLLIIIALIVGAIGFFLWSRSKQESPTPGPGDAAAGAAAASAVDATAADAGQAADDASATVAEAPASGDGEPPADAPDEPPVADDPGGAGSPRA